MTPAASTWEESRNPVVFPALQERENSPSRFSRSSAVASSAMRAWRAGQMRAIPVPLTIASPQIARVSEAHQARRQKSANSAMPTRARPTRDIRSESAPARSATTM